MNLKTIVEDQQKILEDAKKTVKQFAYFMKKQLQNANLRRALRHASNMINQLKLENLSPRNYFILFMSVFDEMRQLEKYFKQQYRRGRKMTQLYQAVQQSPFLLPRLYLLITVGSVYIQSHQQGCHHILQDLLQMIRAIQNPLRGLFLRYYFLKTCKDRLPDTGTEYESQGRGVKQAIQIIFTNLQESVFLWIRLNEVQNKTTRKEKDRMDLKVLIGEGLLRISSLEGLNLQVYKSIVLPRLFGLIKNSKDIITQQYLLDCIIHGFPQQFHINTLPEILSLCQTQLEKEVDRKLIFISLMDRLSEYASKSNSFQNMEQKISIYQLFKWNIINLAQLSKPTELKNVLKLQSAFLKFTIKCYPSQSSYINQIIKSAVVTLSRIQKKIDEECQTFIVKFLTLPIQSLSIEILTINEYPNLMKYLQFTKRREVAYQICKIVTKLSINLIEQSIVNQLLEFINPLLISGNDYISLSPILFKDEQLNVCKLIFLINSQDPQVSFSILKAFIQKFKLGGIQRIKYTYPSTLFRLYKLIKQMRKNNEQIESKNFQKILDLCSQLLKKLSESQPKLAIKLYLQLIQVINGFDRVQKFFDEFTYELTSQLLQIYESQISDADTKISYLTLIIGYLKTIQCMSQQNYDTIITNVVTYSSKILKKNDQCSLLLTCSHLYSHTIINNKSKVFDILKKTTKIANTCVSQSIKNLYLILELINKYAYYNILYSVTSEELNVLIKLWLSKLDEYSKQKQSEKYIIYWKNTKKYLQYGIQKGNLHVTL